MGKILRTTKSRLAAAIHPLVSYPSLVAAGVAAVLGAGLFASAPARADDDPTVPGSTSGAQASRSVPEVVQGPPRIYHGRPMQRPVIQHRPFYRDRYYEDRSYRDRYHRDAYRRGHPHCRDRRYRYYD